MFLEFVPIENSSLHGASIQWVEASSMNALKKTSPLADVHQSTLEYERWLGKRVELVRADLETKHQRMNESAFMFLRATFYRWMQRWPELCAELNKAPNVLAVGDLHLENFGTWRDDEGRLVWGINDFDEAFNLPYTLDLVRLCASAELAIRENHLSITPKLACQSVLSGYKDSITAGGRPFALEERHAWLRDLALASLADPIAFWARLELLPELKPKQQPEAAVRALRRSLPAPDLEHRVMHRVAGMGSLGRQRLVAVMDWRGGKIARETKALAPSACLWAIGDLKSNEPEYTAILERAIRCPDPAMRVRGGWIVRRLAPDSGRIEITALPKERHEAKLLYAMGWETANIHLGSPKAIKAIRRDLETRIKGWLEDASHAMAKAITEDWITWKETPSHRAKASSAARATSRSKAH